MNRGPVLSKIDFLSSPSLLLPPGKAQTMARRTESPQSPQKTERGRLRRTKTVHMLRRLQSTKMLTTSGGINFAVSLPSTSTKRKLSELMDLSTPKDGDQRSSSGLSFPPAMEVESSGNDDAVHSLVTKAMTVVPTAINVSKTTVKKKTTAPPTRGRKRPRKIVKVACLCCARSKVRCAEQRPCPRCVRKGKVCVTVRAKKRVGRACLCCHKAREACSGRECVYSLYFVPLHLFYATESYNNGFIFWSRYEPPSLLPSSHP